KKRFRARASQYAHGATRSVVIVNRTALAALPAENQRVIRRPGAQKIAPIRITRESDEALNLVPVDIQALYPRHEQVQRNALMVLIEFPEQLVKGDFVCHVHSSGQFRDQ